MLSIGSLLTNGRAATPTKRLTSLDGMRGVAALIVVCYHFASAFLPWLIPDESAHPFWIADTPIGILFNGRFSVSIFFVLSGFVVAQAAARSTDPWYENIPLRYVRLAVPAASSVLLACAVLKLFPLAATHVWEVMPHPWMKLTYQGDIPGLLKAAYDGLIGIFIFRTTAFNNVLWTMPVEAAGSFSIYLLYGIANLRVRSIMIVLVLLTSAFHPVYIGFLLGIMIRELWVRGKLKTNHPMWVFGTGILIGFPSAGFYERAGLAHIPKLFTIGLPKIAAALLLYAVLNSTMLDDALSSRVPQFLGRISFPLYLIHVPLIYTFFSIVYLRFRPSSALTVILFFGFFLVSSSVLAFAGEYCVDSPVLHLLGRVKKHLRSRRLSPKNMAGV